MKRSILFILLFACLKSVGQLPNTTWNHPRYTLGNLRGTRWIADVTATQTRYVLFDDIEQQFINDSVWTSRNAINKLRDSMFSALGSIYVPQTRTLTIKGITFDLTQNRTWTLSFDTTDISNFFTKVRASLGKVAYSSDFVDLINKPTTLLGYGITDAYNKTQSDGNYYPIAGGNMAAGGYIGFPQLSTSPLTSVNTIKEFQDSIGRRTLRYPNGYMRSFVPNITASRIVTWPDKDGTLATTGDNISQFTNDAGYLSSISNNSITNAKLATMAAHTFKGNNTGSTANALDLTQAQLTAEINTFTTTLNGLVPAPSTSNTTDFLRRDGSWAAPSSSGMSNPMTTLGDIIYENSTPAAARLAGNTSATKQYLQQTGNGSVSAAPVWGGIVAGDVPTLNQNTTGSAGSISGTNVVTNANIVQAAANSIKGNNTGSAATQIDMTVAQTKTLLNYVAADIPTLAPVNNPTFTGIVTFPTGTSSVAPINIPAGTLLGTATAGKVENDGNTLYFTPTGTQRGIMPAYQFSTIASGTVALSSATGLQSLFNSATDAVSLNANMTYRFEGDYFISKGTVTTCTVNTGFTYSGTMATIAYTAFGMSAALDANGTTQGVYVDRLTSTAVTSTGTAAGVIIHISGRMVTTTAGTLTPQIAFSAAPGGTNTVNAPTYFEIYPVGIDTMTSVGAWQ